MLWSPSSRLSPQPVKLPPAMLPSHKVMALGGGAVALWVAVASPLALVDHQYLTAHMVQHILLTIIAGSLFLLGTNTIRPRIHAGFWWLASTAVVIGWHVPALF